MKGLVRRVLIELITQNTLQDFTAWIARNRAHKLNSLRLFEACQFALTKLHHICLRNIFVSSNYYSQWLLAPALALLANDRSFADTRMLR